MDFLHHRQIMFIFLVFIKSTIAMSETECSTFLRVWENQTTVCDCNNSRTRSITCPAESHIVIMDVVLGTIDGDNCDQKGLCLTSLSCEDKIVSGGSCTRGELMPIVEACNGRTSCTIHSDGSRQTKCSDGTSDYTNVRYTCMPEIPRFDICHGNNMTVYEEFYVLSPGFPATVGSHDSRICSCEIIGYQESTVVHYRKPNDISSDLNLELKYQTQYDSSAYQIRMLNSSGAHMLNLKLSENDPSIITVKWQQSTYSNSGIYMMRFRPRSDGARVTCSGGEDFLSSTPVTTKTENTGSSTPEATTDNSLNFTQETVSHSSPSTSTHYPGSEISSSKPLTQTGGANMTTGSSVKTTGSLSATSSSPGTSSSPDPSAGGDKITLPAAALYGGVGGGAGLLLLLLIIVCVVCCRRRSKQKAEDNTISLGLPETIYSRPTTLSKHPAEAYYADPDAYFMPPLPPRSDDSDTNHDLSKFGFANVTPFSNRITSGASPEYHQIGSPVNTERISPGYNNHTLDDERPYQEYDYMASRTDDNASGDSIRGVSVIAYSGATSKAGDNTDEATSQPGEVLSGKLSGNGNDYQFGYASIDL